MGQRAAIEWNRTDLNGEASGEVGSEVRKRGGWKKRMGKREFPTPNKRDPMAAVALRVGVFLH